MFSLTGTSISSLAGKATTLPSISSKLASNHFGSYLCDSSTKALNFSEAFTLSLTVITSLAVTVIEGISTLFTIY